MTLEEAVALVRASDRYRIQERLVPPTEYAPADAFRKKIGLLLDVETTGLDVARDVIIELGLVAFEYHPFTGQAYRVLEVYNGFQDPGFPLPAEIVKLTGITDAMLAGQSLDLAAVQRLLNQADLVFAHNASFDRQMVERQFPAAATKPWSCSWRDLDWKGEGFKSANLEMLALHYGFFVDAHRAVNDAEATLHLLTQLLPKSGKPVMLALLEGCRRVDTHIWAVDTPFAAKELLKKRDYRWSGGEDGLPKAWHITVPAEASDAELHWLANEVYKGKAIKPLVNEVNALNRYSRRDAPQARP